MTTGDGWDSGSWMLERFDFLFLVPLKTSNVIQSSHEK